MISAVFCSLVALAESTSLLVGKWCKCWVSDACKHCWLFVSLGNFADLQHRWWDGDVKIFTSFWNCLNLWSLLSPVMFTDELHQFWNIQRRLQPSSLVPQSLNFVISGDDRISAQTYLVIWIFYYVSHDSELQLTSSLMNKSHCL